LKEPANRSHPIPGDVGGRVATQEKKIVPLLEKDKNQENSLMDVGVSVTVRPSMSFFFVFVCF